MTNRRQFIAQLSLGSAVLFAGKAMADNTPVSESDPLAVSMGYKADAAKVDKAKFPKYTATSKCSNCALFQGKATDASGPCGLFGGKQVPAGGWCNAWSKKA
jgi:hypothetical protein